MQLGEKQPLPFACMTLILIGHTNPGICLYCVMVYMWIYTSKKLQIVSVVETGGGRIFLLFECFANHLKSQGKNKTSFWVYQFKRRGASMLQVLYISSNVISTTV